MTKTESLNKLRLMFSSYRGVPMNHISPEKVVADAKSRAESLRDTIATKNRTIDRQESDNRSLRAKIRGLEDEILSLQKERDELKAELEAEREGVVEKA